jgi:glutamate-1-semialdehyde aminotransferase
MPPNASGWVQVQKVAQALEAIPAGKMSRNSSREAPALQRRRRVHRGRPISRFSAMIVAIGPATDWDSAKKSGAARFGRFFRATLERGVYLAASPFEAAF